MIFSSALKYEFTYGIPSLDIQPSAKIAGLGVFTTRDIKAGCEIYRSRHNAILQFPNDHSIQIETDSHLYDSTIAFVNHSCEPNALFDTVSWTLIALKDICQDEEITIFYPATAWKVAQPFKCLCGKEHCLEQISGAHVIPVNSINDFCPANHITALFEIRSLQKSFWQV